jgi:drug/metabolite transporter (DMT)-like permease
MTESLAKHPAAKVGIYLYLEPLFTTIAAIMMLGETFTFVTGIGGAAICAGVYISSINLKTKVSP